MAGEPAPPSSREPVPRLPPLGSPNVLFQQFRTAMAVRDLMQEAVAGTGLTVEEYAVLGVVHSLPGRTPTEIAAALGLPATSVSRHVAHLLRDGFVERSANPDDGRSYLLHTTPRGGSATGTIAARVKELVAALEAASERPLPEIGAALVALEEAARRVATDR